MAVLLRPPWRRRLLLLASSAALGSMLYEPAGMLVALFGSRQLGLGPPSISAVVVASGLASVPAFLVNPRASAGNATPQFFASLDHWFEILNETSGMRILDNRYYRDFSQGRLTGFSALAHSVFNECVEFSNFHRWDCINVSSHGIRSQLGAAV